MMDDQPTSAALRACASWLAACLTFGWQKSDLDGLEALWWRYHDRHGRLVQAPREETR